MIFNTFEQTDIVDGKTSKISSGFWPNGNTSWSSSYLESGFWDLSNDQTPSTAYGSSQYDIRKTLYYTDVYPDTVTKTTYNDPYFSISYGNINGSGSFDFETGSIQASPTKAIYTQYKNLLLGTTDLDGKFSMMSGSTYVNADDIFVINFSTYKTKNKIDEGVFEISFGAMDTSGLVLTFIDDSYWTGKVQNVYQLVQGSLSGPLSSKPNYQGIGLLYPNDGIAIFNAATLNRLLSLDNGFNPSISSNPLISIKKSDGTTQAIPPSASYYSGSKSDALGNVSGVYYVLGSNDSRWNSKLNADLGNQNNTEAFFWSLTHSKKNMTVRKSEFVPSKHYFVRVKNRDYNYSNNPTYVYDGKESLPDGTIPPNGTIRNQDFYTDPRTYITTIGLYNDSNELVAVAKLSRPAVKTFSNEILAKIRLDF